MSDLNLLVLWDIDHTLIETSGLSRRALVGAFQLLTGLTVGTSFKSEGRTDLEIIDDLYGHHLAEATRRPSTNEIILAVEDAFTTLIPEYRRSAYILPGVEDLLQSLASHHGVVQAVVTGNIETNAWRKLALLRLDRWFDTQVSAFGSDGRERSGLVALARFRARTAYGLDPDASEDPRSVLVGDTIADMRAAQRNGIRAVGAATGADTVDDLLRAGCEFAFVDLSDVPRVRTALLGYSGDSVEERGRADR